MIVNRLTYTVKLGRMQELLDFVNADRKKHGYNYRMYQSNIGTFDQVAFELEFEDLAAFDKFWSEWIALPETAAFMEKFNEMTLPGGTNEIWNLIE